jgi:hypothetical protein
LAQLCPFVQVLNPDGLVLDEFVEPEIDVVDDCSMRPLCSGALARARFPSTRTFVDDLLPTADRSGAPLRAPRSGMRLATPRPLRRRSCPTSLPAAALASATPWEKAPTPEASNKVKSAVARRRRGRYEIISL